jgi:hypothetical protein
MPNESRERPTRSLVRPWGSGDGATSTILGALPSSEWTVFDRVRLPGRRTPVQVAVGPQGIFVVESRQRPWAPARDELRLGGVRQDVVVRAARAAAAVSAMTGLVEARNVTPVVCFLGREVVPVVAGDVVICSSRNLLAILTSGAAVVDDDRRRLVTLDLDTTVGAAAPTRSCPAPSKRGWLRAQLVGLALACVGALGMWQLVDAAAGVEGPGDAVAAIVR